MLKKGRFLSFGLCLLTIPSVAFATPGGTPVGKIANNSSHYYNWESNPDRHFDSGGARGPFGLVSFNWWGRNWYPNRYNRPSTWRDHNDCRSKPPPVRYHHDNRWNNRHNHGRSRW